MPSVVVRTDVYALELAGEDDALAAYEAGSAAGGPDAVSVVAPGVATTRRLDADRVRTLALVRRAGEVVARAEWDAGAAAVAGAAPAGAHGGGVAVEAAVEALSAASLDRTGTVAVRARDVRGSAGVDTRAAERSLGAVLVDRGFAVDLEAPDHELRALFSDGVCLLGWLVAESERGYGERAPTDRPFFQPGSMDPLLARALANVALGPVPALGAAGTVGDAGAVDGAVAPGDGGGSAVDRPVLLDPMCGTGGVLVEAGLVGARVVGADAQPRMARGAARNLRAYLGAAAADETAGGTGSGGGVPAAFDVLVADARRLPVRDGAVDAVVFDAPYGRQSKVAGGDLASLVGGALAEARRVVRDGPSPESAGPAGGRAVVVGDRSWADAARAAGWTVVATFERRVHRSLTRHVLVLE